MPSTINIRDVFANIITLQLQRWGLLHSLERTRRSFMEKWHLRWTKYVCLIPARLSRNYHCTRVPALPYSEFCPQFGASTVSEGQQARQADFFGQVTHPWSSGTKQCLATFMRFHLTKNSRPGKGHSKAPKKNLPV